MQRNFWGVFIVLAILVTGCAAPTPSASSMELIDLFQEPYQQTVSPQSYIYNLSHGQINLTTIAEYRISAMVMSKKYYYSGWAAKLAPVDLALAWGRLTDHGVRKHITYWQSNRWYYYRYKSTSLYDSSYISTHSSNHHLIPATSNVLLAIRSLKRTQPVRFEGFLVNLKGTYRGSDCWWNSSLSRTDTGDGACELFWVQKVQIGTLIYQ